MVARPGYQTKILKSYTGCGTHTISPNIQFPTPSPVSKNAKILILKIRNVGGQSTVDAEAINDQHREVIASVDPGGGLMIEMERINSQLSLLHEKVFASVDPGGGSMWRGSTVNFHFHMKR